MKCLSISVASKVVEGYNFAAPILLPTLVLSSSLEMMMMDLKKILVHSIDTQGLFIECDTK